MSWLGKLVGGTIGFALGGPLGAIAGATFGHAFDKNSAPSPYTEMNRLSMDEESHLTFFVAAFSMLAKLVKADGQVTRQELDAIERFMRQDLNLSPQSQAVAMNIFNTALNSPQSFQDFAVHFYSRFRLQPQILEFMIDILIRVSVSDGSLRSIEENLIRTAVAAFGLDEGTYRNIRSRYAAATDHYYAVLGVTATDPEEQIKHRYRKLVSDFHPDKIAAKGLPEEFTKFAQDKFMEIQNAYDMIKKERGFK